MWNLLLTDEEKLIADSVREYLERESPVERFRPSSASARDVQATRAGMVELGWLGLGLPESVGGAGSGLSRELLLHRECGRFLVSPSVLATGLAAHVAFHCRDTELARSFVNGAIGVSLGILHGERTVAGLSPGFAFDWNGTDPLLLWNDVGMGLFSAQSFTQARPDECLDESVTMQTGLYTLDRPRHWVPASQTPLALRAQVLLAAELVGIAEQACDITIGYAKLREQFGRPIGAFQAVKHRCADMGVRWRLGWYQTSLACLKMQAAAGDATLQVAAAKLVAAQAAHENARAAIQLHGGIGFQSECDVHLFMKRAHLYDQSGGSMRLLAQKVSAEPSPLW